MSARRWPASQGRQLEARGHLHRDHAWQVVLHVHHVDREPLSGEPPAPGAATRGNGEAIGELDTGRAVGLAGRRSRATAVNARWISPKRVVPLANVTVSGSECSMVPRTAPLLAFTASNGPLMVMTHSGSVADQQTRTDLSSPATPAGAVAGCVDVEGWNDRSAPAGPPAAS